MKKTLTWAVWLSLSAVSPIALAVGLGQATVSSYLNAPLEAAIPLLESSGYAIDDIRVSVADQADFEAAGLEWTPLAASVRAQVVERQGRRQVQLSSGQTMQEPWLDLLLAIEFPSGQQFRDLTLLFDPQDYSQQQSSASQVSIQSQPQSQSSNQSSGQFQDQLESLIRSRADNQASGQNSNPVSVPRATSTQPSVGDNISAPTRAGDTAYVSSGDTLWGVAERVKPAEASVQQMMLALLEANPSVFPSGNIHGMRAGQTLQVPDTARVLARSSTDAAETIQAMNEAWRTRRNAAPDAVPLPEVQADVSTSAEADLVEGVEESAEVESEPASEAEMPMVSDVAIAAAQSLQALEGSTRENDQRAALTRAELTEQLRLSQATLQQVLEERELMRAELSELRDEVASLNLALREALAAQQQTLQDQPPSPHAASMGESQSGVSDLIARYQWPLALTAIALLLGALMWLRKRREETWQTESFSEPVIRPGPAAESALKKAQGSDQAPLHPAFAVTEIANPENDSQSDKKSHTQGGGVSELTSKTADQPTSKPAASLEESQQPDPQEEPVLSTDQWFIEAEALVPLEDEPQGHQVSYQNSQAAGLAMQGYQRRMDLQQSKANEAEGQTRRLLGAISGAESAIGASTDHSNEPIDANGDSAVIPESPQVANEIAAQAEAQAIKQDSHFIDYHPPTLTPSFDSREQSRVETPMQPTVEFSPDKPAITEMTTKTPLRPIEEEWEIEEVAFKPLGRDNGDPSKSST